MFIQSLALMMLATMGLSSAVHAGESIKPEAATNQDLVGNVQYTFGGVPSIKVAPMGNAAAGESCVTDKDTAILHHNEGAIRYNKMAKALEFCNGTVWASALQPALSVTRGFYDKPAQGLVVAQGTFAEDGAVGGLVRCNGGSGAEDQRLRVQLSLWTPTSGEWFPVAAATAQDIISTQMEIDASSFFSYVPKGVSWQVVVTSNQRSAVLNTANCSLDLTRFGS